MDPHIVEHLKRVPMFKGLPEEVLAAMGREIGTRALAKDEALIRKGDSSDSLFIIRRPMSWSSIRLARVKSLAKLH
jgi:signal-transduction protein with cAMP-binding, CBS, and nucleotidyltransferase domain